MAKRARTEWTDKLQARAQNVVFHLAQGKEASLRKLDPVSRNLLRQRVPKDVLVHPALLRLRKVLGAEQDRAKT